MASCVGRVDDEAGIAGLRVVGQHVEPCPMEEGGVTVCRPSKVRSSWRCTRAPDVPVEAKFRAQEGGAQLGNLS